MATLLTRMDQLDPESALQTTPPPRSNKRVIARVGPLTTRDWKTEMVNIMARQQSMLTQDGKLKKHISLFTTISYSN